MTTGQLKVVGSGLTGWVVALSALLVGQTASAQSTFDPYNPSTGQYQEFVTPQFPSNLALPGQARQAYDIQRQTNYGDRVSAGTAFERFLRDGYEDRFSASGSSLGDSARGRSGMSGPGVPYYAGARASARSYAPNAQADRDFNAIRKERERRYFEAIREKDPTKRAKLLRRVNEPIDPQDIVSDEAEANPGRANEEGGVRSGSGSASDFRIARNPDRGLARVGRERDIGASGSNPSATDPEDGSRAKPAFRMPLAGEPLGPSAAKPTAGPAPLDPPSVKVPTRVLEGPAAPTPPSRRRSSTGPERRPLMPSEMVERNRSNAAARPSTPARNPITPTPPR